MRRDYRKFLNPALHLVENSDVAWFFHKADPQDGEGGGDWVENTKNGVAWKGSGLIFPEQVSESVIIPRCLFVICASISLAGTF